MFAVFGAWALLTGAAQLVVVLRRRAQLGNQWPLLLANGVSIIGGLAFIGAAVAADDPKLRMLARRRRQVAPPAGPIPSAS